MIILEPTVEFEPCDWIGEKAHSIIGAGEWNEYWDNFLKTLEIVPAYSGSWFIPLDRINKPEVLKNLIQFTYNDKLSLNQLEDDLTALIGGYMLFENDKVLFNPQCCCDLGDLIYWKELVNLNSENWHNLLMGHAMMYARRLGNDIEIKEIPENANLDPITERVNQNDLQIAILKAEKKVNSFKEKIFPVINEMFDDAELSKKISKRLIGQL